MEKYIYTVQPDESINRWLYTKTSMCPFNSYIENFYEPVNLTEEYRQVTYPVRKQFLQKREDLSYPSPNFLFQHIYFPFENPRVEFSAFISTPHVLCTYAKTYIDISEEDIDLPFTLSTCGGVKIWVNGKPQIKFSPFTRNIPTFTNIKLSLKKGINEIVAAFDDLAERDVNYFFELKFLGSDNIKGFIPVYQDPHEIKKAEKFLDNLSFTKDIFKEGEIELNVNEIPDMYRNLYVKINDSELINPVFEGCKGAERNFKVPLEENTKGKITIGNTSDFHEIGLTRFDFGLDLGNGIHIYRKLVTTLYNEKTFPIIRGKDLKTRKLEALSYFSELDIEDFNTGLARLALYKEIDERTMILLKGCFQEIEEKADCADFRLAPLLAIAISMQEYIPKYFLEEIKDLSLNFRYWIDEPGNDVMWYFSENHAFLFHVSQYLAGYMNYDKVFEVSKRLGKEQYKIGKERLLEWFNIFNNYGFAEWNSTTYLPIDLIGFYSLYEAAPDKEIKEMAKRALNFTFSIIAINTHGKTMASTYGRVYEHDLKAMETSEISNITYILWKEGYLNHSVRSTVWFCLSNYEPPNLIDLVKPMKGQAVLSEYLQGVKKVYTYVYKTKDYSIASAINFNAHKKGHQQHTLNISLSNDNTTMWINHPGEYVFSGENRPSYWAGNGRCPNINQYKKFALVKYSLRENDIRFVHCYIPNWNVDEIIKDQNWLFIRKNNSYVAIFFNNSYEIKTTQSVAYREARSYGSEHLICIRCSSYDETGSFDEFISKTLNIKIEIEKNNCFEFNDFELGKFYMNKEENLYLNNKKIEYKADYTVSPQLLNEY